MPNCEMQTLRGEAEGPPGLVMRGGRAVACEQIARPGGKAVLRETDTDRIADELAVVTHG